VKGGARALIPILVMACGGGSDATAPVVPPSGTVKLAVQQIASGLSNPDYLISPPGDARLFVVEQPGRIQIIQNGALVMRSFLDITAKVLNGGERGLLSVAFHPKYVNNGFFYVYYTDVNGDITVERYTVSSDPNVADPASATLILRVAHPVNNNHNGGLALFGPDGKLYLGLGDGGGGGDPSNNAQNTNVLLGKLLRIDVDAGSPYAIPGDNPFAGQTGRRGEIWAYGLRNPWRYTFDNGTLYIADVGQNAFEEIDAVSATRGGVNYGWNIMEGSSCYNASSCTQTGLQLPVLTYDHSSGQCSIIGGYVYRGAQISGISGEYFYSDYCARWLRSVKLENGQITAQHDWGIIGLGPVLSFGRDDSGEMYILTANGIVYKVVPG